MTLKKTDTTQVVKYTQTPKKEEEKNQTHLQQKTFQTVSKTAMSTNKKNYWVPLWCHFTIDFKTGSFWEDNIINKCQNKSDLLFEIDSMPPFIVQGYTETFIVAPISFFLIGFVSF